MEQEYFSKGAGTAALTTGIIGTALGTMGSGLLSGFTGGNQYVNRETYDTQLSLIDSNRRVAILESELNTERKMVETYTAMSERVAKLEKQVADNAAAQAVINCGLSNNIGILQTQVNQLMGMTKLGIPAANVIPASTGG